LIEPTAVIVAVIAAIPAIIAAVAVIRTHREIRTRNGRTTGRTIDDAAQTLEIIQAQQHTNAKEIIEVGTKLGRIEETVDRIDGRVDRVDTKLDRHLVEVGESAGTLATWVRRKMDEEKEA